jgi:RHS repeat-associated protein
MRVGAPADSNHSLGASGVSLFGRNGLVTSTFSYDNNGNLTQKTVDGTSTTYVYDYANRLIALGAGGATTTYCYDAFGARVLQTGTTTTTIYPFKWYSIASSTGSGAKYATTTDYVFNGDTLLATVDQQTAGGVATGTAQTSYIHPDHLGSTNVVTNASGTVIKTLDYYPFGAQRINSGTANTKRQYIGRFSDDSNLMYLNARYYNPSQGQFISQDPIFQRLGSTQGEKLANRSLVEILKDPQSLNSYSYANNNPISIKDPSGLIDSKTATVLGLYAQVLNLLSQIIVLSGGGGSINPISTSMVMLAHSTTINPQGITITSGNQQQYGNVINKIQTSNDFHNYLDNKIKEKGQNGTTDISSDDSKNSFIFASGDLHTSLNKVNAGLHGTESVDGTWNISVNISDTYNFDPKSNYGNGAANQTINSLNNEAYIAQQAGVVSTYPMDINFDYTYKPR